MSPHDPATDLAPEKPTRSVIEDADQTANRSNSLRRTARRDGVFSFLLVTAALAAIAFVGYCYLPETRVAAQQGEPDISVPEVETEGPTQAMIYHALNFRSASGFSAFAVKGFAERGDAAVSGAKLDGSRSAKHKVSTKELADAIDAMRQLPCTDNAPVEMAGRTFGPGVHCLSSAELNGEIVIDGRGQTAGTVIFLIAGPLKAANGASVRLENGAQSSNVFFLAQQAEIADDVRFRANLLAEGDIMVGRSTVTERVMALGKVELNDSAIQGGTTGTMRICVEQPLPVPAANDLSNRIFHFSVTGTGASPGTAITVPTGRCSKTFVVGSGPQTVTELNSGSLINPAGGTFEGNFELINVANLTPQSPSTLGLVNLATRTANVNVAAGDVESQITLRFTNRRAVTGFVEICKQSATGPEIYNPGGGDPDVQGYFNFTVNGVYSVDQQNPNVRTLQVFTIPADQCTGPIAVTKGDPAPYDIPDTVTSAAVSELPRPGTYFERAAVFPAARRSSADVLGSIVEVSASGENEVVTAPGGGYVNVLVKEAPSPEERTIVTFWNRSDPGRLKICKIAGPGIPVNTLFRFTVTGTGALSAANPQSAGYGPVTRTVDVRAGDPAQGGSCEFVPGVGAPSPANNLHQTFVNGTPITIVENGLSPANTVPQETGSPRVSQVRVFDSTFTSADVAGYSPNPDTSAADGRLARATIFARHSVTEVEFSGFQFNPTVLKVCSKAPAPMVGTSIPFTVTHISPMIGGANPGPMFPPFTQNLTVTAGPQNSAEGNCGFVDSSALPGGAFNQGSTVRVTQGGASSVASITSTTAGEGGLIADLSNRSATFTGPNGLKAGVNSVVFESSLCSVVSRVEGTADESRPGCTPPDVTKFDFDGDRKADPAVFMPSTGMWSVYSSISSQVTPPRQFGLPGDVIMPADYDGDGRTDLAAWRPSIGRWYIQGSTNVYEWYNWGVEGDIPQTGDYDGDGRSDLIVFRPSNASWYIRTRSDQIHIIQFGIPTDKPYAADYDGDGRTDLGVFRNGSWYTMESMRGFRVTQFGLAGDVPVPADYDGDGKTDYAVFRSGTWYILTGAQYLVKGHGNATDIPVPADYDGDGKTDLAVYREAEGRWYFNRSSNLEFEIPIELGGPGYIPVQAPLPYRLP